MTFGPIVPKMNGTLKVLVLAYCNCWHSLSTAYECETLTIPPGVSFKEVQQASATDDSCSDFSGYMNTFMAKELNDATAKQALQKVSISFFTGSFVLCLTTIIELLVFH